MSKYKRLGLIIAGLGVLVLLGSLAILLWPHLYKHTYFDGLNLRRNRLSGAQSMRTDEGWEPVTVREATDYDALLPVELTGQMHTDDDPLADYFRTAPISVGQMSGTIYNGTNSYLRRSPSRLALKSRSQKEAVGRESLT